MLGEIAIIVLGVLIALAVNDWAQARNERKLERRYLERLHADAQQNLAALDRLIADNDRRVATLAAYDAWVGGAGEQPAEADLQGALCRWFIARTPEWHDATYAELVGSGNFTVLRDEALRVLLGRAAATHDRTTRLDQLSGVLQGAIGPFERHRAWQIDTAANSGTTCRFDHAGLRADPQTRSMLAQLHREQSIHRDFRVANRDAVRAVLDRIAELQAPP